ncbi:MAG: ABC transporter ATP-binding protein [Patescibacteria group bacterium]|jgi:lipopolysaccharide transport system ATP-binding protein
MPTPIINVEHLSKSYILRHKTSSYQTFRETAVEFFKKPFGASEKTPKKEDFWALQDINFEVTKGEVIGIIGPNGSGKSTLLKILSQITAPTKGEISIRGQVASLLEVGTGFHPELTGRENIFLNGSILGLSKKEIIKKFDEIVEFSGVEKFLDTPVKRYSSGMHVRLAFSVAAHMEPDILIIDEVLAVGDAEFQKKCLGKMESITKSEGRTILFVSHNLIAVQKLCNRAISLDHGHIRHIGPTAEVIKHYLTEKSTPLQNPQLEARAGVGSVHFTNIKISNIQGSGLIKSNDSLRFNLEYTSNIPNSIEDARVVITVSSELSQQTVLRLDTEVAAETINPSIAPRGKIVCETGPINLTEGKYLVEIDFLIHGTSRDHIIRAAEFDVEANLEAYNYKVKADQTVCDYVLPYKYTQ